MRERAAFLFLVWLFAILTAPASAQTQAWAKRFDGPLLKDDRGTSIAVDAAGNTYVAGISGPFDPETANGDAVLLKYAPDGALLWTRFYSGPAGGADGANALTLDGAGNPIIAGYSFVAGPGFDLLTAKYDADGNLLWAQRYNGPGNNNDVAMSVAVDASGSVYAAGYSVGSGTGVDFVTVKYAPDGVQLWASRYAGPSDDTARSLALDASGNVFVAGRSYKGANTGAYDLQVVKYDTDGNQLWADNYNSVNLNEEAGCVTADAAGNAYVTGYSNSALNSSDVITLKYSPGGARVWEKRWDSAVHNADVGYWVAVDGAGAVYVTGYSSYTANGARHNGILTLRYDPSGNELWSRRYDATSGLAVGLMLALDGKGNVYSAGQAGASGNMDLTVLKYDAAGTLVWTGTYNGPANKNDAAAAIALGPGGTIHVTGGSTGSTIGSTSDRDVITIKYVNRQTAVQVGNVSGTVGETVTLSATLTQAANGSPLSGQSLTFKLDGVEVAGSPVSTGVDGTATLSYTIPSGSAGSHALDVSFPGSADWEAGSGSATLTAGKIATALAVENQPNGYPGGTFPLKATLTRSSDGAPLAGRTVKIWVTDPYGNMVDMVEAVTDDSGVATRTFTVPSGSATPTYWGVGAVFDGDEDHQGAGGGGTLIVRQKAAITVSNVSGTIGATVTLRATLKVGSTSVADAAVTFYVDGAPAGTATTDSTGLAKLPFTVPEPGGAHMVRAVFDGNDTLAPASGNGTLTANLIKPTLSVATVTAAPNQTVNLKATLKGGGALLAGKAVAFKIDGVDVGSATTDASGIALLPHTVTESLGTHTVTASFAGDGVKYGPAAGTGTLKVQAATKVTADVLKAPGGSSVTYGAKLTRTDTLTPLEGKTLSFYAGTTLLGTGVTDANGRATISATAPGVGVKQSISVKFAGDAQYKAASGPGSITGI